VNVVSQCGSSAQVYSVEPFDEGEPRRLGVFTDADSPCEKESYFLDQEDAAEFLAHWVRG
jgi:hypothetical protein